MRLHLQGDAGVTLRPSARAGESVPHQGARKFAYAGEQDTGARSVRKGNAGVCTAPESRTQEAKQIA